MIFLTIILLLLAAFANSAMDVLNFRYSSSTFYDWSTKATKWGRFWSMWAGPSSWENKYYFTNPVVSWLLQGPMVFTTDAWHFLQFIMWTCMQTAVAIWLPGSFWLWLAGMKIGMGFVFEAGWKAWQDEWLQIFSRQADPTASSGKRELKMPSVLAHAIPVSWVLMVVTFFLSFVAFRVFGGDPDADWSPGATAAIAVVVAGQLLFWGIRWYLFRKGNTHS